EARQRRREGATPGPSSPPTGRLEGATAGLPNPLSRRPDGFTPGPSSPPKGRLEGATPSPPTGRLEGATPSHMNEEELRQQARLWQIQLRNAQAKLEAKQEAQAQPGAPQAASVQPEAWDTLPEHVRAAISAKWDVIVEDAKVETEEAARDLACVAAAQQEVESAEALRDASQASELRRKAELATLSEPIASAERDSQAATLAIAQAQAVLEAARAVARRNATSGASSAQAAAGASSVSPSALGKAAAASALTSVFLGGGRRASPASGEAVLFPDATHGSRAAPATSAALAARLGPPPVSAMPPSASAFVSGHRKGDKDFFEGSVACMATDARSCFTEDAEAVVHHHARVVLAEFPATPPLSVGDLWAMRSRASWEEQRRSEHIMRLVVSLRQAHDGAPDQVFWPPAAVYAADMERMATRQHLKENPNFGSARGGGGSG
ncbi:unnamed protein product, partial [Laminaria digitata]